MSIDPVSLPHQPAQQVVTFTFGRWMKLSGVTAPQKAALAEQLTITNPRRMQQVRYTCRPDEDEPTHLMGYQDLPGDELLIAPGAARAAWHYLEATGAACQCIDPRPSDQVLGGLEYTGETRDYQAPFVDAMLRVPYGMGVGPCGSGKTDTAIQVMVRRRCRWLIVVRQTDLVRQWKLRIEARTGGTVSVYKPQNKKKWDPTADFIIGTAQALMRHPDHCFALDEICAGLCVDECDEVPASTMIDLMQLFSSRFRIGFTATPVRADGTTPLMYWWLGPEAARIEREVVEEQGHLMRARLEVLTTPWRFTGHLDLTQKQSQIARQLRQLEQAQRVAMLRDPERLRVIANRIRDLAVAGRSVIVPVDSIAYGYALREQLRTFCVGVEFCHAKPAKDRIKKVQHEIAEMGLDAISDEAFKISRKERTAMIERVANGTTRVVIATSLADRGLDIPVLDVTVLATPGGSARRIEQQMGRSCRPVTGKPQPLCVYVVDPLVERITRDVSRDTGEVVETARKPLLSRFKRNYYNVFRKMADADEVAVRRVLKGDHRDQPSPQRRLVA